jgi:hypothetical protein
MSLIFSNSVSLNGSESGGLSRQVLRLFRTRHSEFIQQGNGKEESMILKNYLKRAMPLLSLVVFVLGWLAIAPLVRAVAPAPDGGYSGFNTAEGQNACST